MSGVRRERKQFDDDSSYQRGLTLPRNGQSVINNQVSVNSKRKLQGISPKK